MGENILKKIGNKGGYLNKLKQVTLKVYKRKIVISTVERVTQNQPNGGKMGC